MSEEAVVDPYVVPVPHQGEVRNNTAHVRIPMSRWGKDHWSLLGYLEHLAVESKFEIQRIKMRCNAERHPLCVDARQAAFGVHRWQPEWGSNLRDGEILPEHDDWDCLYDLEEAGLVNVFSTVSGFFKLTPEGLAMAHQVREHKANGGRFANFVPTTEGGADDGASPSGAE